MSLKMPQSTGECLYFTRRSLGSNEEGNAVAWVYKRICPKCKKAKMGKPVDDGHVKIRAKEYVCPSCGYTEDKETHEVGCKVEIMYKCPFCGKESEATAEYKLKSFEGAKAYVFECSNCKKKIGITKKMKSH